jgi:hypothetical protein
MLRLQVAMRLSVSLKASIGIMLFTAFQGLLKLLNPLEESDLLVKAPFLT